MPTPRKPAKATKATKKVAKRATPRKRAPAKPRATLDRAPELVDDIAIVTVTLHRATGRVELDETFSTPAETYAMLEMACERHGATLDAINGTE